MNIEHKKEQVRIWSAVGALVLSTLPLIKELRKKEPDLSGASLTSALGIGSFSYYLLSSVFWPEPLSIKNRIFLLPCGIVIYWEMKKLPK